MSQNATREEFKGDFLGFTFDDYHSSVFGIVRTSQSDRYNENLLPTMQDKTVQVPGGDGTYYFGSYYTQRQFTINFAFDSMTEKQLRRLKEVFGDRKIHDLIFDEVPYKIYSAKCTGTPQVKYLCFDEQVVDEEGNVTIERRYKGEGTLQFTAYYPFARGRFKYIDEEVEIAEKDLDGVKTTIIDSPLSYYSNINEWGEGLFSSRFKEDKASKVEDEFSTLKESSYYDASLDKLVYPITNNISHMNNIKVGFSGTPMFSSSSNSSYVEKRREITFSFGIRGKKNINFNYSIVFTNKDEERDFFTKLQQNKEDNKFTLTFVYDIKTKSYSINIGEERIFGFSSLLLDSNNNYFYFSYEDKFDGKLSIGTWESKEGNIKVSKISFIPVLDISAFSIEKRDENGNPNSVKVTLSDKEKNNFALYYAISSEEDSTLINQGFFIYFNPVFILGTLRSYKAKLHIKATELGNTVDFLKIDFKKQLVLGGDFQNSTFTSNGELYNYIVEGKFPKLDKDTRTVYIIADEEVDETVDDLGFYEPIPLSTNITLEYDDLYY